MEEDYDLAFTDGSNQEDGKTGVGWTVRNDFHGGRGLGTITMVLDSEVTAIAETLRRSERERLLILSYSKAAIEAMIKAGKRGQGRTKELREAVNLIAKRCRKDIKTVYLSWVKSNIGIEGNEVVDKLVNGAAERQETE